jgi:hypothetical protein
VPRQVRGQPVPRGLLRQPVKVVEHHQPLLALPQPAVDGLDLALLLGFLTLRQLQTPGQAGEVADQRRRPVGAQPEAAVRVVAAVLVDVAERQLRLAHPAQAVEGGPGLVIRGSLADGEFRDLSNREEDQRALLETLGGLVGLAAAAQPSLGAGGGAAHGLRAGWSMSDSWAP